VRPAPIGRVAIGRVAISRPITSRQTPAASRKTSSVRRGTPIVATSLSDTIILQTG
jgi:hypothetical protein